MLKDYEVELLEKMVQEEQYKNNIPLCTPFVKDFLEEYKKLKDRATPKKVKVTIISKEHGSYQCDCPVCGCFLSVNCKDVETKFCRECGQAISWEDEGKKQ